MLDVLLHERDHIVLVDAPRSKRADHLGNERFCGLQRHIEPFTPDRGRREILFERVFDSNCNWTTWKPPKPVKLQLVEVRVLQANEASNWIASNPNLYRSLLYRDHKVDSVKAMFSDIIAKAAWTPQRNSPEK